MIDKGPLEEMDILLQDDDPDSNGPFVEELEEMEIIEASVVKIRQLSRPMVKHKKPKKRAKLLSKVMNKLQRRGEKNIEKIDLLTKQ